MICVYCGGWAGYEADDSLTIRCAECGAIQPKEPKEEQPDED